MWSHDSSSMSLSKPTVTGVSMLIWLTRGVLRQPRPGAADSMQQAGLVVCQPRKRVRFHHPEPRILSSSLDLVKCDVTADKPAQKWVGDITYISTWEGFAYLSGRDGAATRRKSSGTRLLSICALNLLLML